MERGDTSLELTDGISAEKLGQRCVNARVALDGVRKNGVSAYRNLKFSHSGIIIAFERTARLDCLLACMRSD